MSYEKQTWAYKDEITAEKLNHMEEGISSAGGGTEPLIVRYGDYREVDGSMIQFLDTTFGDIINAVYENRNVLFQNVMGEETTYYLFSSYSINTQNYSGVIEFGGNNSFPVGDMDHTMEELLSEYPHVYTD